MLIFLLPVARNGVPQVKCTPCSKRAVAPAPQLAGDDGVEIVMPRLQSHMKSRALTEAPRVKRIEDEMQTFMTKRDSEIQVFQ
jgi:hypothetical protein